MMVFSFLIVIIWLKTASVISKCYYPTGKEASGDSPCNTSVDVSSCCGKTDYCLDNNYCFSQTTNIITRGSCTDESWQSHACPLHCTGSVSPFHEAAVLRSILLKMRLADSISGPTLIPILNGDESMWCCGSGLRDTSKVCTYSDTTFGFNPFSLEVGHLIFNRSSGSTGPNSTDPMSIPFTVSVTPAHSVATVIHSSQATKIALQDVSSQCLSASTYRKDMKIGLSLGILLVVAFFAALVFGWWKEHQKVKKLRSSIRDMGSIPRVNRNANSYVQTPETNNELNEIRVNQVTGNELCEISG